MTPIKGVSETRRLPRLGKIRLGIKTKNQSGTEYPKAVDYFVLPPELAQFGEKPRELPIMFLTDDDPEQWYKAYSKSRGLVCRGDGERAMALVDIETGDIATHESKTTELREVPCNPKTCPVHEKKQCHQVMNLQFYVRGTELLGVYQLDTGSFNSIINVNSSIAMLRTVAGRLAMIPMTIVVEPRDVQVEGRKKTVYVLQLHINMAEAQDAAQRRIGAPVVHALPSPETGQAPDDLYPDDVVADEPSFKPEPRPEPKRKPAQRRPEPSAPKPHNREAGSITVDQKQAINNAIKDEKGKAAVQGIVKAQGFDIKNSGDLSDYQAAIILHVLDGGDAKDIA